MEIAKTYLRKYHIHKSRRENGGYDEIDQEEIQERNSHAVGMHHDDRIDDGNATKCHPCQGSRHCTRRVRLCHKGAVNGWYICTGFKRNPSNIGKLVFGNIEWYILGKDSEVSGGTDNTVIFAAIPIMRMAFEDKWE
ncbi:MAG: hypothetical protein MR383_03010, partial [Lachnospiraceae bacterium]|nr:hypothetical protein [Lachnospiraceae bacterium]